MQISRLLFCRTAWHWPFCEVYGLEEFTVLTDALRMYRLVSINLFNLMSIVNLYSHSVHYWLTSLVPIFLSKYWYCHGLCWTKSSIYFRTNDWKENIVALELSVVLKVFFFLIFRYEGSARRRHLLLLTLDYRFHVRKSLCYACRFPDRLYKLYQMKFPRIWREKNQTSDSRFKK